MFGIRGGKHPHEVALLVATFLLGLGGLLFYDQLASPTVRLLTPPFGHLLYAGMALTASITLVGVFRSGVTGALTERVGLWGLSAWSVGYSSAILAIGGNRGIMFGGFMASYAIANVIRAGQISREVRELVAARLATEPEVRP